MMTNCPDLKLSASANANRQNNCMICRLPSTLTLTGPKRNFIGSLRQLIWLRPRSISGAGIRSARSSVKPRLCACDNSKTFSTNRTLKRTPQYSVPLNLAIRRVKPIYLSLFKDSCQSWLLKISLLPRRILMTTTILWPIAVSRSFSRKKFLRSTNMCI